MGHENKLLSGYTSLRAADQAVLNRIASLGDDLGLPRHTLLFFYQPKDGGSASFDVIVGAAEARSLKVSRLDADGLILEGELRVDPASLKPLIDWAMEVALDANADFDGWECAVVTKKH